MTRFSRRRFLDRLGLAASAPLLLPVARKLVSEARGAPAEQRRCALFFVIGECLPATAPLGFVPEGAKLPPLRNGFISASAPFLHAAPAAPSLLAPLARRWSKMAIVDGLVNNVGPGTQHGYGFACLSGLTTEGNKPEYGGRPTGISIDQFVAQRIGRGTPLPSILFGFNGSKASDTSANTFSGGRDQPLGHVGLPSLLYAKLLGKGSGAAPGGDDKSRALLQTRLLDSMRDDVKRLQAELASPERERLDGYLGAIADFDRRQQELQKTLATGNCGMPPAGADGTPEQRLASMFRMTALALRCGLTNVVGVSIGNGFGHSDLALFRDTFGGPYGEHSYKYEIYATAMHKLVAFFTAQVEELLASLGPLADSTTFLLVPGSGVGDTCHHSTPRVAGIVYDGTGTLRTGGRYVCYPQGQRSVVDLFTSVAHAAGAPTDRFGEGGLNVARGPLTELGA
jgi:hypothetical protein